MLRMLIENFLFSVLSHIHKTEGCDWTVCGQSVAKRHRVMRYASEAIWGKSPLNH